MTEQLEPENVELLARLTQLIGEYDSPTEAAQALVDRGRQAPEPPDEDCDDDGR
jgi:hypothetical protein